MKGLGCAICWIYKKITLVLMSSNRSERAGLRHILDLKKITLVLMSSNRSERAGLRYTPEQQENNSCADVIKQI